MESFLDSLEARPDVWERIRDTAKPVVLYGTGDGADKLLSVLSRIGVSPAAFFASDEFARGQRFRGERVLSRTEMEERFADPMILIAFGSNRPEVLRRFSDLCSRYETLAPDLPVAGETVFDRSFLNARRDAFAEAYSLLEDAESRRIFRAVLTYKVSGDPRVLLDAVSDPGEVRSGLIRPEQIRVAADLGAYTGDTVRELLDESPSLEQVYAMEPDAKSFAKLRAYAQGETRAQILPFPFAAWSRREELPFFRDGSRGSAIRSRKESPKRARAVTVQAVPPDEILSDSAPDWIKYDVEGAEAEALRGTAETIRRWRPRLQLAMYHRTEDLFSLPLLVRSLFPFYRLFLRRFPSVPAWELQLYAVPEAESSDRQRIR